MKLMDITTFGLSNQQVLVEVEESMFSTLLLKSSTTVIKKVIGLLKNILRIPWSFKIVNSTFDNGFSLHLGIRSLCGFGTNLISDFQLLSTIQTILMIVLSIWRITQLQSMQRTGRRSVLATCGHQKCSLIGSKRSIKLTCGKKVVFESHSNRWLSTHFLEFRTCLMTQNQKASIVNSMDLTSFWTKSASHGLLRSMHLQQWSTRQASLRYFVRRWWKIR